MNNSSSLPPSPRAAFYHGLRSYHQVITWRKLLNRHIDSLSQAWRPMSATYPSSYQDWQVHHFLKLFICKCQVRRLVDGVRRGHDCTICVERNGVMCNSSTSVNGEMLEVINEISCAYEKVLYGRGVGNVFFGHVKLHFSAFIICLLLNIVKPVSGVEEGRTIHFRRRRLWLTSLMNVFIYKCVYTSMYVSQVYWVLYFIGEVFEKNLLLQSVLQKNNYFVVKICLWKFYMETVWGRVRTLLKFSLVYTRFSKFFVLMKN